MTPDESLAWLYGLQQFGIKLGLANIRELLRRLGEPQAALRCVHVAGTNGKGSVCTLLAEMLQQAGYRVGLYTSPHLHRFTERVRIDGVELTAESLALLAGEVRAAAAGIPATFFEATTALALLAFQRAGVEVAVLETGMGGRLDATNAVEPVLCLITPVSLDHQEHLGATLAEIAAEKAGIIKAEVPVVAGLQDEAAMTVIGAVAARRDAELWLPGRDYQWGGDHSGMWFRASGVELSGLRCALAGTHQLANFAQALAGAALLRRQGLALPDAALRNAGTLAVWPGRLEWWGEPPCVLLDGAHNATGAAALAAYLAERNIRAVRLVAGLSGQRRAEQVLAPLLGRIERLYAVPVPETRTVPPAELISWACGHDLAARAYPSPEAGLAAALDGLSSGGTVVVAGSLYLVAAARGWLRSVPPWTPSRPAQGLG